jgi:subtilase family serine protease
MAAQGQSIYAVSGDDGAYDCADSSTTLAVDDPASQPYMIGVDGTHLTRDLGATIKVTQVSHVNTMTNYAASSLTLPRFSIHI